MYVGEHLYGLPGAQFLPSEKGLEMRRLINIKSPVKGYQDSREQHYRKGDGDEDI